MMPELVASPQILNRDADENNDGFSLIELIVYMLISAVVLSLVAAVMFSMFTVKNTVNLSTTGASSAQLVSASVRTGVRNSTAVALTAFGADQILTVRTLTPADSVTGQCMAWWYSPAGNGTIKVSYGTSSTNWPDTTAGSQWTLLAQGVTPTAGAGIFTLVASTVTLDFLSAGTSGSQTRIETSQSSHALTPVSSPCF